MSIWRCPDDYDPNETSVRFCKSKGLNDDMIADLVFEMKDFEYKREHKDWDATFRWWIRNGIKFGNITPPRKPYSVEELSPEERKSDAAKAEATFAKYRERG